MPRSKTEKLIKCKMPCPISIRIIKVCHFYCFGNQSFIFISCSLKSVPKYFKTWNNAQ